jgi:hypothetical protein
MGLLGDEMPEMLEDRLSIERRCDMGAQDRMIEDLLAAHGFRRDIFGSDLPSNPLCGSCEEIASKACLDAPPSDPPSPLRETIDRALVAMRRKQAAFDELQSLTNLRIEKMRECERLRVAEEDAIKEVLSMGAEEEWRRRVKEEEWRRRVKEEEWRKRVKEEEWRKRVKEEFMPRKKDAEGGGG